MVDRFVLRRAVVLLSLGAAGLAARPAVAQGGGQQQPYENLKYFPKSARTYEALARARMAKNDRQGAIQALETASNLDPQREQIRAQLQRLKAQ